MYRFAFSQFSHVICQPRLVPVFKYGPSIAVGNSRSARDVIVIMLTQFVRAGSAVPRELPVIVENNRVVFASGVEVDRIRVSATRRGQENIRKKGEVTQRVYK